MNVSYTGEGTRSLHFSLKNIKSYFYNVQKPVDATRSLSGRSARCETTLMVKRNAQRYRLKDKTDILGNTLTQFFCRQLNEKIDATVTSLR